jgi:hypothetical protein
MNTLIVGIFIVVVTAILVAVVRRLAAKPRPPVRGADLDELL